MIEGLRLLPFVADVPILNCDTCQNGDPTMLLQPQTPLTRQMQGCPYLPAIPRANTMFGVPEGVPFDRHWKKPSTCAGYLVSLPEVAETVQMRPQWQKGTLALYLRGADINDDLSPALNAQAILDGAVNAKQNHEADKRAREAEEARKRGG